MTYDFKNFKPMLLSNDEYNLEDVDYTDMVISPKHDGVRIELTKDGLYGRSLKRIPNTSLQEYFSEVIEELPKDIIIECELWHPSMACRELAGLCNRKESDIPEGTRLMAFDMVILPLDKSITWDDRHTALLNTVYDINLPLIDVIDHYSCGSITHAKERYQEFIDAGYEGAVMNRTTSPYKQGRVTIRQGYAYKMKPHQEDDLEIIGVTERMENTNESQTNELGRSFKRNTKEDKQPLGIAAAFICRLENNEECKVTIHGDEDFRRGVWNNRDSYIGKYAVVKSMAYGAKTKLRHPRLLSIKESIEK